MMTAVIPEPRNRIFVRDGTPRHDEKPTKPGVYGVVLKRGVYIGSGSQLVYNCWLLIDGDCSPTNLWSNQFEIVADELHRDKVFWELAEKWIARLNQ